MRGQLTQFCDRVVVGAFLLMFSNYLIFCSILNLPLFINIIFYLIAIPIFVFINIKPIRYKNWGRLTAMINGRELLVLFTTTFLVSIFLNIWFGIQLSEDIGSRIVLITNIFVCLLALFILCLNGVVRLIATSSQLGIKWRALFLLFWWVPIINVVLLAKMCGIVRREYEFETEKRELDETRKECETCKTKYPLLLVHGVFFRDMKLLDYWGRIPRALKRNGSEIYYGQQQSAASIKDSAVELGERILQIVQETGCEKLNIIAHSKGGLDSRYAISCLGMDKYVASLTTINTPHGGCAFADYLLNKIPKGMYTFITHKYNSTLKKLGDKNPDFMGAVADLTERNCSMMNNVAKDVDGILYQSIASKMNTWTSAPFPQNITYIFAKCFCSENDGLVSVESARWGSSFQLIKVDGKRGISHGDMIDLYRQNIKGFDVREFYVDIVRNLKSSGY